MSTRPTRFVLVLCSVLVVVGTIGGCGADGSDSSRDAGGPDDTTSSSPDEGEGTTSSSPVEGEGTSSSSSPDEGEGTGTATPTTASAEEEGFTGEWDSTFGILRIVASGNRVQGAYEFCAGMVSGTINGELLEGTWEEDTSACEDPESAARVVADGTFSFTLDPGGDTFTGYYETTGSPERNEWTGNRIS